MRNYFRNLGKSITGKSHAVSAETLRALIMEDAIVGKRVGRSYSSLVRGGYEANVAIYRAITDIARSAASVQLDIMVDNVRQVNHPIQRLLRRPSLTMTGKRMLETALTYFQLDGNTYFLGVDGSEGREALPVLIRVLRPDLVKPIRETGHVRYEVDMESGRKNIIVRDTDLVHELLHIHTVNPRDSWTGLSPLIPARTPIDRHNLADEWNTSLLRNGAKPTGALVVEMGKEGDASLGSDERESLREELESMYSGPENAGRPPVLEGGLKWQAMGLSPLEMDWSESKASAARDAVSALGYPPMLLGIPGDATFSNQREARLALWETTILPTLGLFLEELGMWLSARTPGDREVVIKANEDSIAALAPKRERAWARVKRSTWISTNEARRETGFDERPEPAADEIMVANSQVPLSIGAAPRELEEIEQVTGRDLGDGTPSPELEPDTAAPADAEGVGLGADNVQQQVLNGGQVTAMQTIIINAVAGDLPRDSAVALLQTAYGISAAQAEALIPPQEELDRMAEERAARAPDVTPPGDSEDDDQEPEPDDEQ